VFCLLSVRDLLKKLKVSALDGPKSKTDVITRKKVKLTYISIKKENGEKMKYSLITILVLLVGCSSNEQLDVYEQTMIDRIDCPGGVERSYSRTFYSTDNTEDTKTTKVTTVCNRFETQTDFEKENRKQHENR